MKRLTAVLLAVLLLVPGALAQPETRGGTFSLPINDDPQIWPMVGGLYNILVNKAVYSTLLRYDLETLEPVGDLASDYSVSDDGLTYTFELREDVLWHDGTPFTAADVVFTMELWTNPDVPYYLASNFRLVDEITALDDYTVEVTLSAPQASFPTLLGYNASILPKHLLEDLSPAELANPTAFTRNPVGTGPFRFDEYQPGSFVRLTRFDDYFDGAPYLDALVYRIAPDANAQLALLQSGELDLVIVEPFQLDAIANNPRIRVQSVPVVRSEFITINHNVPALSDARVRQALTMGLDREQLLESVFGGRGQVAVGPIAPSIAWAFDDGLEPLPYDPEAANALLDEAGWVRGNDGIRVKDGERLSLTILYDPANPTRTRTSLIAQQQWQELGIETDFDTSEYGAILSRVRQEEPDYELNPNYLVSPPDPDGVANYYVSGSLANMMKYHNPEVDALFDQGAAAVSLEERADIYRQIQQIMHEDQPNVFTVYPDEIQALSIATEYFPEAGYRDALAWAHLISKQ